jgi:hypothetical protein
MKFKFDGRSFRLAFERKHKDVTILKDGVATKVRSLYPYTTAKLYEERLGLEASIVAQATVGCLPGDTYSNAKGRLFALRALNAVLGRRNHTKDFRRAMWEAYINRGNEPVRERPIVTSSPTLPLGLPPAPSEAEALGAALAGRTIH